MERARRYQRIEGCPVGWNDLKVRARLRIFRRQRGRFRPARYGQVQRNPSDSVADPQAAVTRQVSRYTSAYEKTTRVRVNSTPQIRKTRHYRGRRELSNGYMGWPS